MKRFRFSLAALLSLRKEQTQECESLLAAEIGKLMQVRRQIENTKEARDSAFFRSGADLEGLRIRENLLRRALNKSKALRAHLADAEKGVEKARRAYLKAHSKSAALEKLKERRRRYWISAARQEEIKKLDEISSRIAPIQPRY